MVFEEQLLIYNNDNKIHKGQITAFQPYYRLYKRRLYIYISQTV